MNKENKVTSLKLSKKIHDKAKEKGFELPESECSHLVVEDKYNTTSEIVNFSKENRSGKYSDGTEWSEKFYKAYDIAELRELIGKKMIETYMNAGKVSVAIYGHPQFDEDTFAEAMGKMFYYLLDNDLL